MCVTESNGGLPRVMCITESNGGLPPRLSLSHTTDASHLAVPLLVFQIKKRAKGEARCVLMFVAMFIFSKVFSQQAETTREKKTTGK